MSWTASSVGKRAPEGTIRMRVPRVEYTLAFPTLLSEEEEEVRGALRCYAPQGTFPCFQN